MLMIMVECNRCCMASVCVGDRFLTSERAHVGFQTRAVLPRPTETDETVRLAPSTKTVENVCVCACACAVCVRLLTCFLSTTTTIIIITTTTIITTITTPHQMSASSVKRKKRRHQQQQHQPPPPPPSMVRTVFTRHAFVIGLLIRFLLAWFLPLLLDETDHTDHTTDITTLSSSTSVLHRLRSFLPLPRGVAYTDMDYHVFQDAAEYVRRRDHGGGSPYQRSTYRYTPFLAVLLAHWPRWGGRYLFGCADALCGAMIVWFRRQNRRDRTAQLQSTPEDTPKLLSVTSLSFTTTIAKQSDEYEDDGDGGEDGDGEDDNDNNELFLSDALWWLYNPFAINICTRGSAESLLALLPVLVTLFWMRQCMTTTTTTSTTTTLSLVAAALAGMSHGVAVHAKLYPLIYTLSLAVALTQENHATGVDSIMTTTRTTTTSSSSSTSSSCQSSVSVHPWRSLLLLIRRWIPRLLWRPRPLLFLLFFVATFALLTYLSVHWYGPVALQEGLLYHLSRVDLRHNYSLHWYWIYLTRGAAAMAADAGSSSTMAWIGRILLLPQLILLLYTSLGLAPVHLTLTLFVQTVLFVTFNKVITAQYFTWYLCLLPLCSDCFDWNSNPAVRLPLALGLWLTSIVTWLASAYCLEMRGLAVHRWVWLASLLFFLANINLLRALLASTKIVTAYTATTTITTNDGDNNKTTRSSTKPVSFSKSGAAESIGHEKEE